jgi:hypothetical protein
MAKAVPQAKTASPTKQVILGRLLIIHPYQVLFCSEFTAQGWKNPGNIFRTTLSRGKNFTLNPAPSALKERSLLQLVVFTGNIPAALFWHIRCSQ